MDDWEKISWRILKNRRVIWFGDYRSLTGAWSLTVEKKFTGIPARVVLLYLPFIIVFLPSIILWLTYKSLFNAGTSVVQTIQRIRQAKAKAGVASRMEDAESTIADWRSQILLR
jgi:hypothetical protein